ELDRRVRQFLGRPFFKTQSQARRVRGCKLQQAIYVVAGETGLGPFTRSPLARGDATDAILIELSYPLLDVGGMEPERPPDLSGALALGGAKNDRSPPRFVSGGRVRPRGEQLFLFVGQRPNKQGLEHRLLVHILMGNLPERS